MRCSAILASAVLLCAYAVPALADSVVVNTGVPDGLMATASGPSSFPELEIETADDFLLSQDTTITGGTFTGLLPAGVNASSAGITIEFYRVFPADSTNPPNGNVPTRTNSPSDTAFDSRSSGSSTLSFTSLVLSPSFTAANSVVNGINRLPNQFTGGEGPVTGQEVLFNFSINPDTLSSGQYFFVPQVQLNNGTFLWLSAPDPITAGLLFTPDLQTWIRNTNLDPNWLRVGTDITQQGPFNAAFSLNGTTATATPEPCTLSLIGAGLLGLVMRRRKG